MERRNVLLRSAAVLMLVMLGGCSNQLPTYRYRLTVEVDTPAGLRSGSSVIEVHTVDQGRGFPGPEAGGIRSGARGEAVAVDVSPGQTMFALLSSETNVDGAAGYAPTAYSAVLTAKVGELGGKHAQWADWLRELKRQTAPAILPRSVTLAVTKDRRDAYPSMIRFRDIRDPRTVEKVDPDDLAKSFGFGVRLKRIVAQITDDPVTTGIQRRLTWLPRFYHGGMLGGQDTIDNVHLERNLTFSSFSEGRQIVDR